VEAAALAGIADRKSGRDKTARGGELALSSFYFPTRRHVTLAQRRGTAKDAHCWYMNSTGLRAHSPVVRQFLNQISPQGSRNKGRRAARGFSDSD
jgi:hypothetical protein